MQLTVSMKQSAVHTTARPRSALRCNRLSLCRNGAVRPVSKPQQRCSTVTAAKSESEGTSAPTFDTADFIAGLQDKWDSIENKGSVVLYGAGAVGILWLSSAIVRTVNALPLAPKLLELVGLGYLAWFVYRYLLFKSSREELAQDVEALKRRISGD